MVDLLQELPESQQGLVVEFEERLYATLDFVPPESTDRGPVELPAPMPLPPGWELAPDDPPITSNVIGKHPWGTAMLVTSSGAGFSTSLYVGSGGSKVSNAELKIANGDHVAPRRCLPSRPSRVLIRYPAGVQEQLPKYSDMTPFEASKLNVQCSHQWAVEVIAEDGANNGPEAFSSGSEDLRCQERCQKELARAPIAWVPITVEKVQENHARRAPGMLYGLEFPWTEKMFFEEGPQWLTKAFHTAGTLSEDNRIVRVIPDAKKVATGNNSNKFLFEVEYANTKKGLHTKLFAKIPFPLDGKCKSDRLSASVYKQPMELYELNTYRLLEAALPVKIPKFYFGDISNETSNWILITERVMFSSTGLQTADEPPRKPLKPFQVEEAYDKCMDWNLRGNSLNYYLLLVRTGARIAGLHKSGRLGSQAVLAGNFENFLGRSRESYGMHAGSTGRQPGKVLLNVAINFLSETGKVLFPGYVASEAFRKKLKATLMRLNAYSAELIYWRHANEDFIALTHGSMNVDNAFFWRDDEKNLNVGVLDWGNMGARSLGCKLWWWLYCAEYDQLTRHFDDYIACLISTYHEYGGPLLDREMLRRQLIITAMEQMQGLCAAVPQLLLMCPKREWATIRDRHDKRIAENVDGKSTLRLYLHVMNSIIRIIEEWKGADVLDWWIREVYCRQWGEAEKEDLAVWGQL